MVTRNSTSQAQKEFKGLAINSGRVVASVCLYSTEVQRRASYRVIATDEDAQQEIERLEQAVDYCTGQLDVVAAQVAEQVGIAEAEIFTAQKHILHDPAIISIIKERVLKEHQNLETVVEEVFGDYERRFARLDNEYLRERSSDIGEIKNRLLDYLFDARRGFVCAGHERCVQGKNRIIVAPELTAQMMAHMSLENVLGIVTEKGGFSSHAAIIARSVGVPAVSGIRGLLKHIECGTRMLVDGDEGRVFLDPSDELIHELIPFETVEEDDVCVISTPPGMAVMANASMVEDVHHAHSIHADGIGLFRTEIAFIRQGRLLNVDEQESLYRRIVEIMEDRPVTFRLLDVGGDKELPFLQMEREANPFLGLRGARFLLSNPEILREQVRALARVSRIGPIRVLFPMVVDIRQVDELSRAVREISAAEGGVRENMVLGVMFEVPSACFQAGEILKHVEFASIGSNDLIQYLFAVDRDNALVAGDYNPDHPVLWSILSDLARVATQVGKPLTICGEMAARPGVPSRLIDIGIRSLSVSPRLIPRIRNEMARYPLRAFARTTPTGKVP